MKTPNVMHFYLEPGLKESAEAGTHNFLNKLANVGRAAGMKIRFSGNSAGELSASDPTREFAVVHMEPAPHGRAVTVRRAYYYPFWSIELSEKRWEFDVALEDFHAASVPGEEAKQFVARWRRKWFEGWEAEERGHVYVPLQGRLLEKRSFQDCAPLEMIRDVLAFEPKRRVIAALHPKESYSDAEIAALEALSEGHRRLKVEVGEMERLLPGCKYVVTQNSSAGFAGYFWRKPLVLFGRIDFHHIAAKTWESEPAAAIGMATDMTPDYDAYLYWFLQIQAINAGRPEAEEKIATRLRGFGWPV